MARLTVENLGCRVQLDEYKSGIKKAEFIAITGSAATALAVTVNLDFIMDVSISFMKNVPLTPQGVWSGLSNVWNGIIYNLPDVSDLNPRPKP